MQMINALLKTKHKALTDFGHKLVDIPVPPNIPRRFGVTIHISTSLSWIL